MTNLLQTIGHRKNLLCLLTLLIQFCISTGQTEKDIGCSLEGENRYCNGRGNCISGICECEKRSTPDEIIYGKFCECDNYSCDHPNGLLCSGPEHGICNCGQCVCKPGWAGSACDCPQSNDSCFAANSNEICSGHGECICGKCNCQQSEFGSQYTGKYCERCPTCPGSCSEYKNCVECQIYHTGPLAKENNCTKSCKLFTSTIVDKIIVNEEIGESLCVFYDEDDCRYSFVYNNKQDTVEVRAEKDRICPSKVSIFG